MAFAQNGNNFRILAMVRFSPNLLFNEEKRGKPRKMHPACKNQICSPSMFVPVNVKPCTASDRRNPTKATSPIILFIRDLEYVNHSSDAGCWKLSGFSRESSQMESFHILTDISMIVSIGNESTDAAIASLPAEPIEPQTPQNLNQTSDPKAIDRP